MSFSDIAARLKKQREQEGTDARPADRPLDFNELYALRSRILGVLIRDARLARNRSLESCAASLQISPETLEAWETGTKAPSLPELELLAYELGVPISHFWGTETFNGNAPHDGLQHTEYLALRNRVVGALLRKARTEADLSIEALAEQTGISPEKLKAYELGQEAIPLTELTSLATATNVALRVFLENTHRIGHWLELQENFRRFSEMPEDMQAFISNPVNASFIELAMWFSELEVNDLRGIAESILHLSRLQPEELRHIAENILNNITL